MKRLLALMAVTAFLGGCSSGFVYQRKTDRAEEGAKVPVKVAVVAFGNGTGDFTSTGNVISGYVFNLARTDINGMWINTGAAFTVAALPPEKWAKCLADDLAASGAFRSVKFIYGLPEVTDEDVVVEGALTKANYTTVSGKPDEFLLHLKVLRMPGNAVVREADYGRSGVRPSGLTSGCFTYGGCVIGRIHGYLNGLMQGIFADVRHDLVRTLAAAPPEKNPDLPGKESPEEVIRQILGRR